MHRSNGRKWKPLGFKIPTATLFNAQPEAVVFADLRLRPQENLAGGAASLRSLARRGMLNPFLDSA